MYRYPDKNGRMVETPYLNAFLKGAEEAARCGFGPGRDTQAMPKPHAPMTFAEAQRRLKLELGCDMLSSPEEQAQRRFMERLGREIAANLQQRPYTVIAPARQQTPARQHKAPTVTPARHNAQCQSITLAEAQRRLREHFGHDPLEDPDPDGPAIAPGGFLKYSPKNTRAKTIVRRYGPVMRLHALGR